MSNTTILVLNPGEMGASVAAAARAGGERVLWVSSGRSTATAERAEAADLEAVDTLEQALGSSDVVVSVCPPHAAHELASTVASHGFTGLYLDANAISPTSAIAVRDTIVAGGGSYVDGGIIGPPAWQHDITRLYLSGEHAARVAALFEGSMLAPIVLDADPFAASAIKMAYAAWTKGSIALLANVRALASACGVDDALVNEWNLSQPGLEERATGSVTGSAFKAWRWIGEMHEIADTFRAAGLPDGFHRASAAVYERQAGFKDAARTPSLEMVLEKMLEPPAES